MPFVRYCYQLLLAVWLGSLCCFSLVVAPTVFRELGPTPQAISVVSRALNALDVGSIFAVSGMILLALAYEGGADLRGRLRLALFGLAGMLALLSVWVVTPRLQALHARAGGSAAVLPRGTPEHDAYLQLHRASAGAMSLELLIGLVAVGLTLRPRAPSAEPAPQSRPAAAA